jgi:hypothetical protein
LREDGPSREESFRRSSCWKARMQSSTPVSNSDPGPLDAPAMCVQQPCRKQTIQRDGREDGHGEPGEGARVNISSSIHQARDGRVELQLDSGPVVSLCYALKNRRLCRRARPDSFASLAQSARSFRSVMGGKLPVAFGFDSEPNSEACGEHEGTKRAWDGSRPLEGPKRKRSTKGRNECGRRVDGGARRGPKVGAAPAQTCIRSAVLPVQTRNPMNASTIAMADY